MIVILCKPFKKGIIITYKGGHFAMKKVLVLCMAALMSIGLCACGSSKSKEDIKENIKKNDLVIVVNLREDKHNYYDENGKCYLVGEETECRRIIKKDKDADNDIIQIINEDTYITVPLKNGKIDKIVSITVDGTYEYDLTNKTKYAELYSKGSVSSCNYYYEGSKKDDPCGDNRKEDADAIKKSYDDFLKDIDLSEDEFMNFINEYAKDEMETTRKAVKEKYKKQKDLTAYEIEDMLNEHYGARKTDDGSYMLFNKGDDDSNFMVAYDQEDSSKLASITYYNELFSGEIGSDNLFVYVYYPETGKEAGVSHGGVCIYDLNNEESIGKESCDA